MNEFIREKTRTIGFERGMARFGCSKEYLLTHGNFSGKTKILVLRRKPVEQIMSIERWLLNPEVYFDDNGTFWS